MRIFKAFGNNICYEDVLQLDGAFAIAHVNYGKSLIFNNIDGKEVAEKSRENKISSQGKIEDVLGCLCFFNGTEKNFDKDDKIQLWKVYWLEYINAFDKLTEMLPNSIVTIFIGRQAIEIGIKYLLLKNGCAIPITHDLKKLTNLLCSEYKIHDSYMVDVALFCEDFSKYIEGGNVEYFRYPEYKDNSGFAGNNLDINWLSYNFALILLKLLHLAELENVFE